MSNRQQLRDALEKVITDYGPISVGDMKRKDRALRDRLVGWELTTMRRDEGVFRYAHPVKQRNNLYELNK